MLDTLPPTILNANGFVFFGIFWCDTVVWNIEERMKENGYSPEKNHYGVSPIIKASYGCCG